MIFYLLSYVVHLLPYRDFSLADIDQFSANAINGGHRPQSDAYFKYS